MMGREQVLIYIAWSTLVIVIFIAVVLARRMRRPETEIILDAIDGTRNQVDDHAKHTALEHEALSKQMTKANGRLQFLIAKDIADALSIVKAADQAKKGEPKEPPA
jgi:hypothetical protein